ncbi:gamma-glutamyl-gamma-aminobutyrate hydrolase family protein [Acidiferrimicrobium sp. IK]|uniref:gamma-glutamyl-gamma-aminobutyrate hydrolase family protein n=1 Tax=Acidiferrimicrobium sp. IK TaxID=2871700 RepID=UPI0021CB55C8|nr:gamma-glutamyl-gamma-aminobutyrate hydrolase family protein [Acidiferrimicrobium sp. IK]MCU4184152.1 gamma-glutamyl-gamma-aminobutyrate hydrolase family protein [Acidiferrimicrobium sp. IK]
MASTSTRSDLRSVARSPLGPLVAVAPARLGAGRIASWTDSGEAAGVAYLNGLRRAGALPAVVGGPTGAAAEAILAPFAGVVLLGGGDLDPLHYGESPHPATYGVDVERDHFELGLARHALEAGIPLLAICRGLQVLNVAMGGTLHQHLPDLDGADVHGVPIGAGDPALHRVDVAPGSRLAAIEGRGGRLDKCVSIHHQAVAEVGAGLVVTARSADGVVEALETPSSAAGWCVAVQWHPERSAATDPAQQAIFDAFVDAAR